ncbi:MAG TPA: hypothetical protein VK988_09535 [Acidimicrobiales bacterium]|nr:hypothetical protein [Acidimicrobiales bacterium]
MTDDPDFATDPFVRFRLASEAITWVFRILTILASAVPLTVLRDIVEPFAGRTTVVQATIGISLTVALSLVVNGAQYLKGRQQRRELQRARLRTERLEQRIRELEGRV